MADGNYEKCFLIFRSCNFSFIYDSNNILIQICFQIMCGSYLRLLKVQLNTVRTFLPSHVPHLHLHQLQDQDQLKSWTSRLSKKARNTKDTQQKTVPQLFNVSKNEEKLLFISRFLTMLTCTPMMTRCNGSVNTMYVN